jgi:dihydroorotate dehydrogenase
LVPGNLEVRWGHGTPALGMYPFLRALLFVLPAESAHHVAFGALRFLAALPWGPTFLRALFPVPRGARVRALGLEFPSPVGLAAGFDKDALGYDALLAVGFGFVEVGTLTARPQPGNPKPRLFRLVRDHALLNRFGFNNRGAEAAARRLALGAHGIVGVNIGKSKAAEEAEAISDYEASARALSPYADYLVVNVSSPNTPGLRDLQSVGKLRPILSAVQRAIRQTPRNPPLLVKIAPDLADDDIDAIVDLALELGLAGIVATNTTIRRDGLSTPNLESLGAGGVSGPVLAARSREVLARLYARSGGRLVLISVGGVSDVEDAWARITAGAHLVQLYTSFVYRGPGLPSALARGLVAKLAASGFESFEAARGSGGSGGVRSNPSG